MSQIESRDRSTGELITTLEIASVDHIKKTFVCARQAQIQWQSTSNRDRRHLVNRLRETLINQTDQVVDLICRENGKPRFEALANEVVPVLECLHFFANHFEEALEPKTIPLRLMKHRRSTLYRKPIGVIAIISPWNYPFLLPMGEIIMALLSGNAVIFKPSEITSGIGQMIDTLIRTAGFPEGLFNTVYGAGDVGAEIVRQKPDKIFFTGSVRTGKKIMSAASENLTPVALELGGKDAMIVLQDADLDLATSAALWGGYSNSGQVCASVERVLVHEAVAELFKSKLLHKMATLKQGATSNRDGSFTSVELGPITFEGQKQVYGDQIQDAKNRGVRFLAGGDFSQDKKYLSPTLVDGTHIEQTLLYREETFGPTIAVAEFRTIEEAIIKANLSEYGLLASVFSQDLELARKVAGQLQVGTVTINEVTYTAGLPETPWGGIKNSGIGRKHSVEGLLEFVNTLHIHEPRSKFLQFKSFWWFPYTPFQFALFRQFAETYRTHWIDRVKSIPLLLWNMVQFLKKEPRI
jgi:acyl-CoA reductase-like NAD-dependent aldehyde dehydrogenase